MNKLAKIKELFNTFPPAAMEFSQRWAGLVKVHQHKNILRIQRYIAKQPIEGLIPLSLHKINDLKTGEIRELIVTMLEELSPSLKRLSLVIPDNLTYIYIFSNLEETPSSREAVLEYVKWKIEKKLPFELKDAFINYQYINAASGKGILVLIAPSDLVKQFEEIFSALDIHIGLILPSSFALVNFYHHLFNQNGSSDDFFFMNISDYYVSFFIFQDQKPVLFRTKNFRKWNEKKDKFLSFSLEQARLTLHYYQNHFRKGKSLTYILGGINPELFTFKTLFEKQFNQEMEIISPLASPKIKGFSKEDEQELIHLSSALGAALGI